MGKKLTEKQKLKRKVSRERHYRLHIEYMRKADDYGASGRYELCKWYREKSSLSWNNYTNCGGR